MIKLHGMKNINIKVTIFIPTFTRITDYGTRLFTQNQYGIIKPETTINIFKQTIHFNCTTQKFNNKTITVVWERGKLHGFCYFQESELIMLDTVLFFISLEGYSFVSCERLALCFVA
jgi:hypothetical protein